MMIMQVRRVAAAFAGAMGIAACGSLLSFGDVDEPTFPDVPDRADAAPTPERDGEPTSPPDDAAANTDASGTPPPTVCQPTGAPGEAMCGCDASPCRVLCPPTMSKCDVSCPVQTDAAGYECVATCQSAANAIF